MLGNEPSIHNQPWPEFDPEKAKADEVELAVQINGKVKARITVAADSAEEDIIAKAFEGKTVVKKIVIPGRLVNIVVK